jgi:16S rRNA (cytosine1402-N4)-methyltransferase
MNGFPDHRPVMLAEVVRALGPRAGARYVDATFGAGGYAAALLDAAACRVVGIDRDRATLAAAEGLQARVAGRLTLVHGRFGDMVPLLAAVGIDGVDGIAFDLGVSSMQLDRAERGFSFRFDGPLDMRMDRESGATAAEVIGALDESDLARVIAGYGEERAARRIARAIVRERQRAPIVRTAQLADIVRGVVRPAADGRDPATRTFQALRILVNDELGELDRGLVAAERLLLPGGRLCVVAFHSLEDRRVKTFLRARSGNLPRPSRHSPGVGAEPPRPPSFRLLSRRALHPSVAEVAGNPRARSARLRAAERTDAPAWGDAHDGPKRRAA